MRLLDIVKICWVSIASKTRLARSAVNAEPLSVRKASGPEKPHYSLYQLGDHLSCCLRDHTGTKIMKNSSDEEVPVIPHYY
jgi:hypothetical protein